MSEEQQKSDQSADLERVWGLLEEYRIAALDTQEAYEWSINNGGNNDAEREAESIQLIALRIYNLRWIDAMIAELEQYTEQEKK